VRLTLPALFVVLALAAASCGGGGKKAAAVTTTVTTTLTATTATTATTHGRFHYPQALVTNYMKSCTSGDAKKNAYCGCTLDKLSNDVSTADFAQIGFSGGKIPPRIKKLITKAALGCVDKLP